MMCVHLEYEVGDEGVGLVLSQVIVFSVQHGKQQLQILQHLHQDCGVGVKEPQGEPLQNQVQTADGGFALTLQPLSNTNTHTDFISKVAYSNMQPLVEIRPTTTSIITPIALTCLWKSK